MSVVISPPSAFISEHDSAAQRGYTLVNRVMRQEVIKSMLAEERSMVQSHIDGLLAHTQAARAAEAAAAAQAEGARTQWQYSLSKEQLAERASTGSDGDGASAGAPAEAHLRMSSFRRLRKKIGKLGK